MAAWRKKINENEISMKMSNVINDETSAEIKSAKHGKYESERNKSAISSIIKESILCIIYLMAKASSEINGVSSENNENENNSNNQRKWRQQCEMVSEISEISAK